MEVNVALAAGNIDNRAPVQAVPALPSATVLLLRERETVEVLMVERGRDAYYGSALVFPGGKVDAADHDRAWADLSDDPDLDPGELALRIAGLRELHEEAGLLVLAGQGSEGEAPPGHGFADILRHCGRRLAVRHMRRLSRWITPPEAPKRFDTHFLLCRYDSGEARWDGHETVSAHWFSPRAALQQAAEGRFKILFPTRSQLHRIAALDTIDAIFAHVETGPSGPVQVQLVQQDGRRLVRIPADAGYAICEDQA